MNHYEQEIQSKRDAIQEVIISTKNTDTELSSSQKVTMNESQNDTGALTVESLRQRGLKVFVRHNRRMQLFDMAGNVYHPNWTTHVGDMPILYAEPAARGGSTEVKVVVPDGKLEFSAESFCSPEDAYEKRKGIALALAKIVDKAKGHYNFNNL